MKHLLRGLFIAVLFICCNFQLALAQPMQELPVDKNVRIGKLDNGLLDAIKDMKRIPGTTGQDIYNRVKSQYFNGYSLPELEKIVSLAKSYPPRVRKVVADILGDIRQTVLQTEMAKTILPTTRFNLDYKTA